METRTASGCKDKRREFSRSLTPLAVKMASRSQEIRAVGAWVQPGAPLECDAVRMAVDEDQRIREVQRQKEAKLKQFQDEVRRRVMMIDRLKRQQQLDKSQRAADVQCKVLSQSVSAAEKLNPRKDRCSVRPADELSIHSGSFRIGNISDGNSKSEEVHKFEEHQQQVHKLHGLARQSLAQRQIITSDYQSDDLPGGVWRHGATCDHPVARKSGEGVVQKSADELETYFDDRNTADIEKHIVRFDVESGDRRNSREQRIAQRTMNVISGTEVDRAPSVPVLRPGVQTEEERVRLRQQQALYRRLFMDIEREQVKENIRQRNHRLKMAALKKEKEEERLRIESTLSRPTVDPLTGLTAEQSHSIDTTELELSSLTWRQAQLRRQKQRETERFLEALKRNLREKIEKQNLEVPPLCSCSSSIWDTNPDTCANNCIFYKNPKRYAKALQSLLASCDVI